MDHRGEISVDGTENLEGCTVVLNVDGGRLRTRRPKPGRKKEGQKRQGFYTDWKEPKLFTICLADEEGEIDRNFNPLYDGTTEKGEGIFLLLEKYLKTLDISEVETLTICCDGDRKIWTQIEKLCERLDVDSDKIFQVIDHPHAVQNLGEILNFLPNDIDEKERKKISEKCKKMLWNGDIQGLYDSICKTIVKEEDRKAGIKKWRNYFDKNKKRMQYKYFRSINIPCGSGSVESAIRRVINLRIKGPGIFWKNYNAEYFLFLRAQLLSGRWQIFIKNVSTRLLKFIDLTEGDQNCC